MREDTNLPPDCPEDHFLELNRETWREYPDTAIHWLEDFLSAYPASVRARLHLAAIYADDYGDGIVGAEQLLREVLALDPDNMVAMVGLALLQGHPHSSLSAEESLELLSRAANLTGAPHVIRNYANKAWETGQIDKALSAFDWLKFVATGPCEGYFKAAATQSIEAIRRGDRPASFVYWWPDLE